jgi:pyruvate dehydrogenase E2 component (dihydrolipoamide acetyltransferase)
VAEPVTMPMLGLTMEEGTVAEWLKQEGEAVQKDDPLLTVEMDKGTVEVPSPASGVLQRIVVQPGQTVPVKALIAEIAVPGGEESGIADAAPAEPVVAGARLVQTPPPEPAPASTSGPPGRIFASPRARMRARELEVDISQVKGTGPRGRAVEDDVLAFAQAAASSVGAPTRVVATPLARRLALEHEVPLAAVEGTGPGGRVTHEDVLRAAERQAAAPILPIEPPVAAPTPPPEVQPLSRVRRITAERMVASARSVAQVTLFLEADLTEAARFRGQLAPEFARLGVPRLPWDALISRAVGMALAEYPSVNAQWVEGQGIRRHSAAHVGVAVALEPEGLVVPVLRHAETRSLRDLTAELLALVEKAHANRLSPEEMQGGTFTITNLGGYRVEGFTPIVNPPETAILGIGRIADKPAVVDGRIEVRTLCTLSLSFDHRVVDGVPAAAFLARVAELLERPYALLGI